MNKKELIILFSLAALWGASFLFIRVSVDEFGAILLMDLRVLLASLVLILYALIMKKRPQILYKWKQYLFLGAVNAAIPFTLIAISEIHLSASFAAILNSTTPLCTALIAWLWIKEPLNMKKLSGLLLGIIGVIILVGWHSGAEKGDIYLSIFYSILATIFYGIGSIYSAKEFKEDKPLDLAIGQQLAAGILLFPFALATLPNQMPSWEAILSVVALAILSTALAYLLYFWLIQNVGAVKTVSVTLLVPVFGVIWGFLFLQEKLTLTTLLGLIIVLISVTLVVDLGFSFRRKKSSEPNVELNK